MRQKKILHYKLNRQKLTLQKLNEIQLSNLIASTRKTNALSTLIKNTQALGN